MRQIVETISHCFRHGQAFKQMKNGCFMYQVYRTHDGGKTVRYWNTTVAHVPGDCDFVILNSDGNRTVTTKQTINAALMGLGLPHQVYQKNGEWWVSGEDKPVLFHDGMRIHLTNARVYS
jgi:hypothetical protein